MAHYDITNAMEHSELAFIRNIIGRIKKKLCYFEIDDATNYRHAKQKTCAVDDAQLKLIKKIEQDILQGNLDRVVDLVELAEIERNCTDEIIQILEFASNKENYASMLKLAIIYDTTTKCHTTKPFMLCSYVAERTNNYIAKQYLAYLHMTGRGIDVDVTKGTNLYLEIATDTTIDKTTRGNIFTLLGDMYTSDSFIATDIEKGIYYLEKGKELGNERAITLLNKIMSK